MHNVVYTFAIQSNTIRSKEHNNARASFLEPIFIARCVRRTCEEVVNRQQQPHCRSPTTSRISMKTKAKFFLHFAIGLMTVLRSFTKNSHKNRAQLVIEVKTHHLNRYLLNAMHRLQNRVTIQLPASHRNLAEIGELKRSGRLGSELLECSQINFRRKKPANVALSIDYFQGQFDNRLPIWRHPKFNESWTRDTSKITQVVFAGSHQSAYREFNEALWAMPNRLNHIEFIAENIPNIHILHWIPSNKDYAQLLATSSHFLCLPGYKMPLCHNLYEAIEFGCVPIVHVSYHKWLEPVLRCATASFTYSSLESLRLLVDRIVSGEMTLETHSAQSKIQDWIDNDYGLEEILNSSIAHGETILCAEEDSVTIHKQRYA